MICKNRIFLLFALILAISTQASLTIHKSGEQGGSSPAIGSELKLPKLCNGDIVLRKGNSLVSDLIARNFSDCEDMSHCGIIVNDSGAPYVVHTISGVISEDDGIRKEPIADFIGRADAQKVIIIRSNIPADASRIQSECDRFLKLHIGFDHEFDADDHATVYCSELVRDVYQASGIPDFFHYTSRYGIRFIDFDTFFDSRLFTRIYQSY